MMKIAKRKPRPWWFGWLTQQQYEAGIPFYLNEPVTVMVKSDGKRTRYQITQFGSHLAAGE